MTMRLSKTSLWGVVFLSLSLMVAGGASRAEDTQEKDRKFDSRELLAETTGQAELVAELSDEQVFAFNRALNDSVSNGLIDDMDADALADALEAALDPRQINQVTHALEQEARFLQQAERFEERYEATGNEQFLVNAERATEKAQTERDKFMAKAMSDGASGVDPEAAARAQTRATAKRLARDLARDEARTHARNRARQEARAAARDASRDIRDQAKLASKELAREQAKEKRRN